MKTSKSGIHFKVDKNVNDKLMLQSDGFEIENCSSLPLRMNLRFESGIPRADTAIFK